MEIEFKFCIPPAQLAAVTAAVRRGRHTPIRMEARYFDTPDAALSSRGIALRLRREGDRWVQTVKALGDGPLDRHEHNVERGPASDQEGAPPLQPDLHAGSAAGDILLRALKHAASPLAETYGTEMDRITRDIAFAGGVAELALDTGRVVAHRGTPQQQEARICELELELKSGPVTGLAQLADTWARKHGLVLSTISKAERGERLLAPQWVRPAIGARALRAGSAAQFLDGATLQRAVLGNCLVQILGNASEIIETTEPATDLAEHIHQLRIGIRRLRTALRELNGLAPACFAPQWEPALKDVFQRLGGLRDREQILRAINAELREAGAPASLLMPAGDAPGHAAADIVRTPAFQSALIELMGLTADKAGPAENPNTAETADTAASPEALSAKDVRRKLQKKLQSLRTRVWADGRRVDTLSAPEQHRLRKRLKRLRYLAEFLAPAFDGEEGEKGDAFLKSLRPALTALGRLHDERVAGDLYTEIASQDARAWFGVGWLAARRPRTTTASRKALARIGEVPRLRKVKMAKANKVAKLVKAEAPATSKPSKTSRTPGTPGQPRTRKP